MLNEIWYMSKIPTSRSAAVARQGYSTI